MTWKGFAYIAGALLVLNLIGVFAGPQAKWLAVIALLVGSIVAGRILQRRWNRRVEALSRTPDAELDGGLEGLSDDDRRAIKLHLGRVSAADAQVDPLAGETFEYKRTPGTLRMVINAMTIIMAALPTVLLILGKVQPDQKIWAAAVGLGFTVCALILYRSWDGEDIRIVVTASGIQELRTNGKRTGILWSEIAQVNNQPWLTAIDLTTRDGRRRVRVWYTLQRFPRFMELLVANLKLKYDEPQHGEQT